MCNWPLAKIPRYGPSKHSKVLNLQSQPLRLTTNLLSLIQSQMLRFYLHLHLMHRLSKGISCCLKIEVVDQRSSIGDWEIDTIIGATHQGVRLSPVESKFRLARLANKSDQEVERILSTCRIRSKKKCKMSLLIIEKNSPSMNPLLKI